MNHHPKGYLMFLSATFLILSCSESPKTATKSASQTVSSDSIVTLAKKAYVYGYPLVIMYETMRSATNVEAPVPNSLSSPQNQFAHFRSFPDATFKDVVKPNNDTYYSTAWLDLSPEPQVLTVPDTKNRYYLLPMLDAYTNVFASPGKRTTGTKADTFLITGPGYRGSVPTGMQQIKAPTSLVWLLGRTQVNSPQDGSSTVKNIQGKYRLTPLSLWGTSYVASKNVVNNSLDKTPPPLRVEKMNVDSFFNLLNVLLAKYPPPPADSMLLNDIAAINIGAGKNFSVKDFDADLQQTLQTVPSTIHKQMREALGKLGTLENGWNVTRSNLGSYGTNYDLRTMISIIGLGCNLNADACYPNCQVDVNGEKLDGSKKYIIHFDKGQAPPANAFWSITMYGADEFLVPNPINRFAIGDRDHLKYNKDGSLDLYIQKDSPGKDKEANWLPSSPTRFSLTMRMYWPKDEFLNGTWKIPGVRPI
jgi:hypothetical protein